MKRRKFIQGAALSGTAVALGGAPVLASTAPNAKPFRLDYAPHLGMFEASAGKDPIAQLHYMADQGFRAFEDNELKGRPLSLQENMARVLKERGMRMGVFVAHEISWQKPDLVTGKKDIQQKFLKEIEDSVAVAKRMNAKWMTVVPGPADPGLSEGYQTANLVTLLKEASAILEPHGLVMVLEPLNFRNHPGLFLTRSPQAYQICKAVDSPACKILFDIYHQQIQEGNLIPNIEASWDEIAYFQIGDNPGRNEPTTGEINYRNVFKFIHDKGYAGILGMEHGNSKAGKDGEAAVIRAYRASDQF